MGGIRARINNTSRPVRNSRDVLTEKLFREERAYRCDRLN